jgi:regulator of protease activity HflC (stomatin/prohibitin superfamily)
MSALDWLGRLGDALLQTLPQRVIIDTTEAGVVWWFGRWPRLLRPGWHVWWPLVSVVQTVPVVTDTIGLARQTVTAADGRVVGVSGWITYRITDPLAVLTGFTDYEVTLRETAAGILSRVVAESEPGDTQRQLLRRARRLMRSNPVIHGVEVQQFAMSDFYMVRYPLAMWSSE